MQSQRSAKGDYNSRAISDNGVIWAYKKLAMLIQLHGEAYIPLFERLHSEIQKIEQKNTMVELAKKVANDNSK